MPRPSNRDAILDAAECLFARDGLDAVSLRAICAAAGLNVAAANYYFGTKDDLVDAILDRRMPAVMQRRLELLESLHTCTERPRTEDVVAALARPMAELIEAEGDAGRSYARMVARLVHDRSPALARFALDRYEPDLRLIDTLLVRANPTLPPDVVRARIEIALRTVFDGLADLPADLPAGAPDPVSTLVSFVAGGISAPAARVTQG